MGGRGGSSGLSNNNKVVGYEVLMNDSTTRYYFTKYNGQNFYQRGVDGTPEPTPNNMSPSEFKQRVTSNGANVKNITASEKSKEEIRRKAERKASDEILDRAYASDREFVRGSRASRKTNRANRRRRR